MDHKQLWHPHSEDTRERLRLLDFVHPESQVSKPVIAAAKARMREITKQRWGKAVAELPAYLPPSKAIGAGKFVSVLVYQETGLDTERGRGNRALETQPVDLGRGE